MKIFIDTADVKAIRRAKAMGFVSGVTTNPSLIAAEGKDFHTDEEKLRFAARHMPDIFSKGSKYEKYSKFTVTKRQKGK